MRRDIRYLLAAVAAAFGLGFVGMARYTRSAGQRRTAGEPRHAFVQRVTRPHLKRFGNELVGEVYDHMDEDERRAA